jgi:response regulator RpfG family c-di-GMP phosphodiesterase
LCGRIVALSDVYDALTTRRVYKPAYSHDVAKAIILDGRGKHFDPDVVDAFEANEDQFLAIKERLEDGAPEPEIAADTNADAPVAASPSCHGNDL